MDFGTRPGTGQLEMPPGVRAAATAAQHDLVAGQPKVGGVEVDGDQLVGARLVDRGDLPHAGERRNHEILADVELVLDLAHGLHVRSLPARLRSSPNNPGLGTGKRGYANLEGSDVRDREEVDMPQQAWSSKRERQYEHIKDGLKDRGRSEGTAKEIAARTVNKERARAGESDQASRTSTDDISSGRRGGLRSHRGSGGRTKAQLYAEARSKGVKGRSRMTKKQLENAVGR